jgi:hypothetical protein
MCFIFFHGSLWGRNPKKYALWLFNIAMEAMAHRNRWFTWVYLLKMVDLSITRGYRK